MRHATASVWEASTSVPQPVALRCLTLSPTYPCHHAQWRAPSEELEIALRKATIQCPHRMENFLESQILLLRRPTMQNCNFAACLLRAGGKRGCAKSPSSQLPVCAVQIRRPDETISSHIKRQRCGHTPRLASLGVWTLGIRVNKHGQGPVRGSVVQC